MAIVDATVDVSIGLVAESQPQYDPAYPDAIADIGFAAQTEGEAFKAAWVIKWNDTVAEKEGNEPAAKSALNKQLAMIKLRKAAAQKEIARLQRLSLRDRLDAIKNLEEYGHEADIWCADLTEDLSGDVGIIEIPGEQQSWNILPGYFNEAPYNAQRDGHILPAVVGTPAGVFWNLAMLPGWQKWKPTFRYGVITAKNGDECDVALEAAFSSQQAINVNQEPELYEVPITYMTCDGAVFEVGDEVVIRFNDQDINDPEVIGFKEQPKRCTQWVVFEAYHLDRSVSPSIQYPSRYVVWDAMAYDFADLSKYGGPLGSVGYPCAYEDLEAFFESTSEMETKPIYDVDYGRQTDCPDGVLSPNFGCGEFYSEFEGTGWDGYFPLYWMVDSQCESGFYGCCCPELPYVTWWLGYRDCYIPAWGGAGFGNSWNLMIAADLERNVYFPEDPTVTCFRMEYYELKYEETVDNDCSGHCDSSSGIIPAHSPREFGIPHDNAFTYYEHSFLYKRQTPIGWMDDIFRQAIADGDRMYSTGGNACYNPHYPPNDTWSHTDRGKAYVGDLYNTITDFMIFSNRTLVQCFFMHRSWCQWYMRGALEGECSESNDDLSQTLEVESGHPTRHTDCIVAVDYDPDTAKKIDPLNQARNTQLETKLEQMMDAAGELAPDWVDASLGDFKRNITDFKITIRQ